MGMPLPADVLEALKPPIRFELVWWDTSSPDTVLKLEAMDLRASILIAFQREPRFDKVEFGASSPSSRGPRDKVSSLRMTSVVCNLNHPARFAHSRSPWIDHYFHGIWFDGFLDCSVDIGEPEAVAYKLP